MMKEEIEANARVVVRELMAEPDALPLVAACAVAGNGWQENLLRPLTPGKKDHGSDGFMQWRLDRLTALQQLPGWNTLPVQARYFKIECKAKYPSLWKQLANPGSRTIDNLVANICDQYERPSPAGRVLDKRIAYAKQVYALFDAAAPTVAVPTSVDLPGNIPLPVAQGIIYILNNLFSGKLSTLGGFASLAYAYAVYAHVQIPNLSGDWKGWVAFAITLIFGVGGTQTRTEVVQAPSQSQETQMDPTVLIKFITTIEAVVPIIEKVLAELPQIKTDIAQLRASFDAARQTDPQADQRMTDLIQKLNSLGGH